MKCEKCKTEMVRIYDVKEIEEEFKGKGLNQIAAAKAQFELLRQMTCPKCGFSKSLSTMEIMLSFAAMRKAQGKTASEIVRETEDKVKEIMKGGEAE